VRKEEVDILRLRALVPLAREVSIKDRGALRGRTSDKVGSSSAPLLRLKVGGARLMLLAVQIGLVIC